MALAEVPQTSPIDRSPRRRAQRDLLDIVRPVHPLHEVVADREWVDEASCRGEDVFFEPFGERADARARRELEAFALCNTCTVRIPCRDAGRRNHENGIWGGEGEVDRALAGYPPRGIVRRDVAQARLVGLRRHGGDVR